ncbi:kelch repeat protein [Ostertagia ostertagi]
MTLSKIRQYKSRLTRLVPPTCENELRIMNVTFHIFRFDPRVGKWEHIRPMTTSRSFLGSAVFDGHLYAAGGPDLSSAEKYNPRTNEWIAVADMNEKRTDVALAVVNKTLYAVGGRNGPFDWTPLKFLIPRQISG